MSRKGRAARIATSCSVPICSTNCAPIIAGWPASLPCGCSLAAAGTPPIPPSATRLSGTLAANPPNAPASASRCIRTPCGIASPPICLSPAPTNVSMRLLRETFLYPFKDAIQKSGAISVMAAYNEIDGVPAHASEWLLRDVLRKEWGFKGFVVSDYYAIWELGYRPDTHGHCVAKDKKES